MQYTIMSGTHIVPTEKGLVRYEKGDIIDCTPLTAETLLKNKVKPTAVVNAENAANEAQEKAQTQANEEAAAAERPAQHDEEVASGRHEEKSQQRKGR